MKYLTLLVFLGISLLCEAQQDSIVPFEKAYKRTYNIRKVSGDLIKRSPNGFLFKKAPGLLKSNANHFYKHETPNRATGGKYPLSRFDVFFVV